MLIMNCNGTFGELMLVDTRKASESVLMEYDVSYEVELAWFVHDHTKVIFYGGLIHVTHTTI